MKYLYVNDWDEHQTYRRDRKPPPWIKTHRSLRSSAKWAALTDAEKGQLVSIWIAAADRDGYVPDDPIVLQRMCQLDKKPDINKFKDLRLLLASSGRQLDATMASIGCQSDAPEAEAEADTERRTLSPIGDNDAPGRVVAPEGSLKDQIWGPCLRWLAKQSEKPVDKLRPLLGKWCKVYGEGAVLEAMQRAERASPVDPVSWLTKALQANGAADGDAQVEEMLRQAAEEADRRGIA